MNGTADDARTLHVFGHKADIPLTEFIYRVEVRMCFAHYHRAQSALFPQSAAIGSNIEWMKVCGASSVSNPTPWSMPAIPLLQGNATQNPFATGMYGALFAALFMLAVLSVSKYFKRSRHGSIALRTNGVRTSLPLYDR
jgi:lysosomal acid phosphatase